MQWPAAEAQCFLPQEAVCACMLAVPSVNTPGVIPHKHGLGAIFEIHVLLYTRIKRYEMTAMKKGIFVLAFKIAYNCRRKM